MEGYEGRGIDASKKGRFGTNILPICEKFLNEAIDPLVAFYDEDWLIIANHAEMNITPLDSINSIKTDSLSP